MRGGSMIYLLLATLSGLLILSFWINRGDIISPSFVFSASFLFACVWAVAYAEKWSLDLHKNTYLVITLGVLEFNVVCFLIRCSFNIIKRSKDYWVRTEVKPITIQKEKYILYWLFELLTISLTILFLLRSGGGTSLASAIFSYRFGDSSDSVAMPSYISAMRTCVNASAYWFSYVFANNFVVNKKIDTYALAAMLLAVLNTISVGSRGNIVYVMLATIVIFIIIKNKSAENSGEKIRIKYVIAVVALLAVIALSYQSIGNLLGRGSTANVMDYLATYCGAEIKNLDIMLQEDIFHQSARFGEQTFINLYKWIGPKFGIKDVEFALTFLSVNGYNLGNVYSIFYPFIYDFGYPGVAAMVFLMAFICQFLYEKIRRKKNVETVETKTVAYGYIFSAVLFSYFSNKFYEQIFSAVFLYSLVFWFLFKLFFVQIRFTLEEEDEF